MLAEARLKWATPNGDKMIAELARVSSPENQHNHETAPRLIRYLIDHRHWSPFEMASMCVEIVTTRDIGRQILRHRSFSFQEFSGRYAAYEHLHTDRELRGQDPRNRQNSVIYDTEIREHAELIGGWRELVGNIARCCKEAYDAVLHDGGAKECARAILPEGLVPTTMYMTGTVRSWIHYIKERTETGVQREHRVLAMQIRKLLAEEFPMVFEAISMPTPQERVIADLSRRNNELEHENEVMRAAAAEARDQFIRYAKLHEAKGTPESAEKAKVNHEMAQKLTDALMTEGWER